VRRFCFNVLRAFALKMRKLPRLSDVGCFPNRRSAFLRFLMASLHSSLNWKVHDDLCGSDHFPIIIESLHSTVGERPTRYKFDKADWPRYEQMWRSAKFLSWAKPSAEFGGM
jgi:hypothetical protein